MTVISAWLWIDGTWKKVTEGVEYGRVVLQLAEEAEKAGIVLACHQAVTFGKAPTWTPKLKASPVASNPPPLEAMPGQPAAPPQSGSGDCVPAPPEQS